MINILDVILIYDELIEPPHPKMVVCVNQNDGWFFRINTRNIWRPCVPLLREPNHKFLDHNSFLHCAILELDDYIIDEAIRVKGIIGSVHRNLIPDIERKIIQSADIRSEDRSLIVSLMNEA
jgi:hypothetical protein